MENVRPSYAVISVGAKNTYGHPHEEVLNNLFDVGAKILRTDVNSRVKIMTDGETLEVSSIK
uniref:Metallo-beta-lactamase domain protein n=1 Tax=Candidatus Giovannonibacteria bacterium GW2011_GWF2_42_19 TaxID=1618659 RepID=A0A0G1BKD4_9BACT|nr:MAG: Metallo-beta-lactamase domain protein [Candidatus Giovannonibacteria bacterium GW2011_GWF2_42_19]